MSYGWAKDAEALAAEAWPATARYHGPSDHADWCRDEHGDGPCLDVLLARLGHVAVTDPTDQPDK